MKLITKFFQIALLLAVTLTTACAQRNGKHDMDPQKRAERMTAKMTGQLSLTEKQQAEIKQINLSFGEKMKALHEQEPGEKHRTEMKALRDEHDTAIAKILTKEQLEKWETIRAERKKYDEGAGKRHEKKQLALHSELEDYRRQNIHPVMAEQRAKLEAKISQADKAQISALKEKLEAEKLKAKERRGEKRKGFEPEKGSKGKSRHGHKPMRSLLDDEASGKTAEKLVETYSTDMDALFAEIAPQQEKWEQDRKSIREKHLSGEDKGKHRRHKDGKPADTDRADKKDFHKKLRFLLMPMKPKAQGSKAQVERKLNVFPNPASGNIQQVEFEVLQAGKVLVEIVDGQGNVVKSVFNGELPAGMKKLEVNTSDLSGKIFYYRITDGKGVTSKSFLMQRD